MKRYAKASSAGSTRAASSHGLRSGRPRAVLAVLALTLTASAVIAASASADTTIGATTEAVSNVSYTSAHITGHVSTPGTENAFFENEVTFQYSTDKVNWTSSSTVYFRLAAEERFVQGDITGLRAATTYYARIHITSYPREAASSSPYLTFTTLPVEPPTISVVEDASEIFSQTAAVAGKVKRPANSDTAFDVTACRFEYVTDEQFTANGFQGAGSQECKLFEPITVPGEEEEVSAELEGLTPATTYHLRLAAENADPVSGTKEAAHTFTTAAKVATPIIIATNDATELEINGGNASAHFSGEIQHPLGDDPAINTACRFEYVSDAQFNANAPGEKFAGAGEVPCAQNPITKTSGNAEGKLPVSADVFGYSVINPSTTYHLRLVAENSGGVAAKEAADTFTTLAARFPVFTVDPATAGYTSAEVSGTINPEGGDISNGDFLEWDFQYSTEPGNPNSWVNSSAGGYFFSAEETPIPVEGTMTGLRPGTTYYFRLWANNYLDITMNSPEPFLKFTTKGTSSPPSVTLEPASELTVNSAHFSGVVKTNAPAGPLNEEAKAAYNTEWHVECTPGCPGLSGTVEAEEGSKAISGTIERLEGNTFYENVKLVAHNELGTVETPAQSFQTSLVLPEVKAAPGGSAGSGSYNIGGVVTPFNSKISNCHFEYGPTTEYVYSAPCSPDPVGRNEVQKIYVGGLEGQFKLTFRGQTTENINQSEPAAVVEAELKALSVIGPEGVTEVEREIGFFYTAYTIHFSGPLSSQNVGPVHGIEGTLPLCDDQSTCHVGDPGDAQTLIEGGNNAPVLVEAHLTGLTPGATYHYQVVASNPLGTVKSGDNSFVSPLAVGESSCPNEQERIENSSTRLPECRAYELVTNAPKGGFAAGLDAYSNNEAVGYTSTSGNIENSGQGNLFGNQYVARRTANGWQTVPNLNGPKGSPYSGGSVQTQYFRQFSPDLERSLWFRGVNGKPGTPYLREANGEFTPMSEPPKGGAEGLFKGASQDLSHTFWVGTEIDSGEGLWAPGVGLGIYEFEGVENAGPPREVDLKDNGEPISECVFGSAFEEGHSNFNVSSADGKTAFFTIKSCEGHPQQLYARVDASKTYFASESQCTRTAGDPGGACYTPPLTPGPYGEAGPADAIFESATLDGSRVFFTTAQQLVNEDTNKSTDLYRYELPSASNSNPSPALIDVTNSGPNAQVEQVLRISEDGSSVYFIAKGVLASNHDSLDETAHDGDRNMYVWHQDASHPEGQTTFIGRLTSPNDSFFRATSEITPDGRYFLFKTYSPMTPTDTDNASDVYRYDIVTGELIRISVNTGGTGGNGDGLDAEIPQAGEHSHPSITDDGQEVIFTTSEALSPDDGNGAPDIYLWKNGRTALISTGSVGGGASSADIDGSGKNIYFESGQELTQEDTDSVGDVYDARIDGGVSFAKVEKCAGETCQPSGSGGQPASTAATDNPQGPPNGAGNYQRATVSIKALTASQRKTLATGGKVRLGVRVSGAGKVSVEGTSLVHKKVAQVVSVAARAVQPGLMSLPISLSHSGLSQLRSKGALKVQLSAVVADSEPATSTVKLKAAGAGRKHSKKGNG